MGRGLLRQSVVGLLVCAAFLAVTGVPGTVRAITENRRTAEAAFLKGVAAYKAKDLKGAVAAFEEALRKDRHPVLLFNLAVLYDKMGDKPKAVRYYKEYLKTNPPDEAINRLRLKQLDPAALQALDKEIEAAKAVAAAGGALDGGKKPDAPVVPEIEKEKGGALSRVGGATWALLGVGVVGLAAGTTFGVVAQGAIDDFEAAELRDDAQDAKDSAEFNAMVANVGFGVGAAALATGVVFLVLDLTGEEEAKASTEKGAAGGGGSASDGLRWSLRPALDAHGGGAIFELRY